VHIGIYYFSGTGNTELVARMFADAFGPGHTVELMNVELLPNPLPSAELERFDLLGFGGPVHLFAASLAFTRFIKRLPKVNRRPAFLFLTAGGEGLDALSYPHRLLCSKGLDVVAESVFVLPCNVFISDRKGERLEYRFLGWTGGYRSDELSARCREQVQKVASAALSGTRMLVQRGLLARLTTALCLPTLYLSTWQMKLQLHANRSCNRCGLCARSCPEANIRMTERGVRFGWRCVMCFRCLNACPVHAVRLLFPSSLFDNKVQYTAPGWHPPDHNR